MLKQVALPVPAEDADEVVRIFERAVTPRTRLILVSHVSFVTGQVLPVQGVVRMGRRHGIPVAVDGTHSFARTSPSTQRDLECDYYAAGLHS
ncbi:MAG: aminotransferase class V-fold PLP-dependent enzyme [Longimicrobiaceae bacterium]